MGGKAWKAGGGHLVKGFVGQADEHDMEYYPVTPRQQHWSPVIKVVM
jgi:hypothetical protein